MQHRQHGLGWAVLLLLLSTAVQAQQTDAGKVVRAVSEKQIQEAVDAHTGTQLLQIVLTGSVRLVKGITLRKGAGPLKLSASKAPAADAEGIPKPSVVLDASRIKPAAPALTVFSTAALQIDGLAITGCKGAPAIYARQSGPLTISASLLKDNNNTGVYLDPNHGGALSCIGCEQLIIEGSSIDSNAAKIGGGIFAVNLAKGIQIKQSWMIANKGGSEGGSIAMANTAAEFTNCTFRASETTMKTGWGGGISSHNSTVLVEDVLFDSCIAGESGSAMQAATSNVTINRIQCINAASSWFAGCLFFLSWSNATVRDSLFRNNTAATAGGAIHVDRGANVQVFNTNFENNTSPYGGAINGQEEGGFVRVRNCRFWNNSGSDKGAAIHVETRTHLLDVADSVFDTNMGGGVGGAVACTTARCQFSNVTFTNNSADQLGGAVWSSSAMILELNSSTIQGNKALRGGGLCIEAPERVRVSDTALTGNTAEVDGGAVLIVSVLNGTAEFLRSPVTNNTAALGGGFMLISADNISLTDITIADNSATINPSKPIVSTVEGSFSSAGSGGGIHGIQCGFRLTNSKLRGNTAAANGGGAALQLCQAVLEQSTVENNEAASGNGGGMAASVAGERALSAVSSAFTNNSAVSGGALYVTGPTNGVAVGAFSCDKCTLEDNRASSKVSRSDRGGGGLMATGNIEVKMTGAGADNNTATSGPGGALYCMQCNSLVLDNCKLSNNTAAGPGGAASCEQCDHVSVTSTEASSNRATAGAGLYLLIASSSGQDASKPEMGVFDSKFTRNTAAGSRNVVTAVSDGSNAGSAVDGEAVLGAGGAVVVRTAAPFKVSASTFSSNNAASGHGGALYHQACIGSTDCTLTIQSSTFEDNKAEGGGGAVFTTNGSLLTLPEDCSSSSSSSSSSSGPDADGDAAAAGAKRGTPTKPCHSSSSFRSSGNSASFGADIASEPKRLGIASGTELAWLRQLDTEEGYVARRRLLAVPPAGSTSEPQRVLYLESNNRFGLEVLQLDHWGSHVVTDGAKPADATIRLLDSGAPGRKAAAAKAAGNANNSSLCAQVCEPGRPCVVGCLTGATTVAFRDGVANFSSVSLSAPANSSLKMQVTPGGLPGVPLVDVLVRVHTCGVGEFQNSAGSCEQCPAPQINLDPYKSANCSSCPFGATCQAGFPTPLPGFWHSHQRSTLFHRCPNAASCTPADGGSRMLAYQQLHKHDGIPGWLQDRTAVGEEYLTAQCAPGRSGPLCSSCARGYGMGPGNVCRKCPSTGRAGTLVAYIVVRLVDVLLVTLFTCVMLLLWSYSRSCFAGSGLQPLPNGDSMTSVPSSNNSATGLKPTTPTDSPGLSDKDLARGQADSNVSQLLACAGQLAVWLLALLDWHQLAYLIFSAAAPLTARGASMLLSLLLTTPQSTLSWVPMECIMGSGTAGRATVATSIISSVYPVLLTLATFGVLLLLKPLSKLMGCGQCQGQASSKQQQHANSASSKQQQQHANGSSSKQQQHANGSSTPSVPAAGPEAACPADRAEPTGVLAMSPFVSQAGTAAAAAAAAAAGGMGQIHSMDATPATAKVAEGTGGSGGAKGVLQSMTSGFRQLCSHLGDACKHLGLPGLFVAAAVASLLYCSVDLAATTVSAFQCTALDPMGSEGMLPGERRAAQGSWWSRNLKMPCYGSVQVVAAAVAGAVCLPLLLLTVLAVAGVITAARYKQNTPTGQQLYSTWLSQLLGKRGAYQQGTAGQNGVVWVGRRWFEALAAAGVTLVAPFKAVSPAAWWALIAVVFRIVLAVLLTAVDNALGSSVLLRAAVASGGLAVTQLLLSLFQPGASKQQGRALMGCYSLLQVLCVFTVAAEALQPVGPASRAVLYTLLVIVGSANCLFMAYKAARSLFACLV